MTIQEKYLPIPLKQNRTYCAYQFHAYVFKDSDVLKSAEDVFIRCILHVMQWMRMKFREVGVPVEILDVSPDNSTQVTKEDLVSFETREIAGYQLEVMSNSSRDLWAMRLREPDLGVPSRNGFPVHTSMPQPGRMYETNVGFSICGNNVEFAINVIISEPENTASEGTGFRPAIVGYLVRDEDICLTDGINSVSGKAIDCSSGEDILGLFGCLVFEGRQNPVVVVCSGEKEWPLDAEKLAHDLFGYTQVFAVHYPMLQAFKERVATACSNDILIFYPNTDEKYEPDVRLQGHPSELLDQTIASQIKKYSTGELNEYGNVLMVADFLFERYNSLNEARLALWVDLDQANQKIAELEDSLETLESENAEAESELSVLKSELDSMHQEVLAKEEELKIIGEATRQAKTTIEQNVFWKSQEEQRPAKTKILFIGGGSHLKEKELSGILKTFGFPSPSDCFDWIKYDDAKGFNFQSLIGSTKYSDIILGAVPHSCAGIGKFESPVSFLRSEKGLPTVNIVFDGGVPGNFSKSNIRQHIEKSEALRQLRSSASAY